MNLGGPELLIVLVVVMLIFGSKKVPELAAWAWPRPSSADGRAKESASGSSAAGSAPRCPTRRPHCGSTAALGILGAGSAGLLRGMPSTR